MTDNIEALAIEGVVQRESFNPLKSEERVKSLMEAVRNKTLRVLNVEPAGTCNLKCTFCDLHSGRVQNVERLKGVMSFDTFKKVVDQLADANVVLKQLQYAGYGDPLLNKELSRFVTYAKEKGVALQQRLITNGIALTKDRLNSLLDAKIDIIEVSVDTVDRERYAEIKGKDFLEPLLKNVAYAVERVIESEFCHLKIKCALPNADGRYGVIDEDVKGIVSFFKEATERCDRITVTGVPLVLIVDAQRQKKKEFTTPCEEPFYALAVRFDGTVNGCCVDALMQLKLGNVNTSTMGDILRGEELRSLRKSHLDGDFKKYSLCKYCENRTATDLTGVIDELRTII